MLAGPAKQQDQLPSAEVLADKSLQVSKYISSVNIKRTIYAILTINWMLATIARVANFVQMGDMEANLQFFRDYLIEESTIAQSLLNVQIEKCIMIIDVVISFIGLFLAILALRSRWLGCLWTWVSEKTFAKRSLLERSAIYAFFWCIVGFFLNFLSARISELESPNIYSVIWMFSPMIPAVAYAKWGPRLGATRTFLLASMIAILYAAFESSALVWWVYHQERSLKEDVALMPLFDLATTVGMPHDRIKILPAGKETAPSAAFMGLPGAEFIVIEGEWKNALSAAVAHELGHFVNLDIVSTVAIAILKKVSYYALGSFIIWNDPSVFEVFGFTTEPMVGILAIADFIGIVFDNFVQSIENAMNHRAEYRADAFSAQYFDPNPFWTYMLEQSAPFEHWLYDLLFNSHPCVAKRMEAMKRIWSSR
jgi:Zn-dependent protease with chaperone function